MTDLSAMSNGDLVRLYQSQGAPAVQGDSAPLRLTVTPAKAASPQAAPKQLTEMSDAELVAAHQAATPSVGQISALDFMNQGSAAGQRTTPIIAAQMPNLLSADVHENDAGELLYRDQGGQLVPTDQNKHVILRDPSDNTLKVFARTAKTDEGRLSAAGRLLSTGMATGAPTARPSIPAGGVPSSDALKAASAAGYRAPEVASLEVQSPVLRNFAEGTSAALNEKGLDENLAAKTFGVLGKAQNVPEDSFVSGRNLESFRRTLGNAAKSTDPTERMAASHAMEALDNFLGNIPASAVRAGDPAAAAATLGEARANYGAAMRSDKITGAAEAADLNAAAANSGMNVDNATRQRIKSILMNPKELRGFSTEEKAQMVKIVRGTPVTNISRRIGNLLGGGGGLGSAVVSGLGAAGGAAAAGPIGAAGAALPVIGYGFRKLANVLTSNQVAKLDEMVRSRAPLSKAVQMSSERWVRATEDLAKNPSVGRYASLTMSARNLANTLRAAGIEVPSNVLIGLPHAEGQNGNQQ